MKVQLRKSQRLIGPVPGAGLTAQFRRRTTECSEARAAEEGRGSQVTSRDQLDQLAAFHTFQLREGGMKRSEGRLAAMSWRREL